MAQIHQKICPQIGVSRYNFEIKDGGLQGVH